MTRSRRVALVALAIVGASVSLIAWRRSGWSGEVALVLATVAVAYGSPVIERRLQGRGLLWPLIVLVSAGVAYVLVGSILDAGWSPIDDHEIMQFLGAQTRVGILEIPALLLGTEVGHPGSGFPRYRPSYYLVRLFETALWGDSPRAWYAAHLVMFAASLALGWRFFTRWIGLIPAGVVLLYMLTYPFWADIWARLGASEVYCVLGTALVLEGAARLAHAKPLTHGRRWGVRGAWAMLGLGAWLAIGSKENFLVVLVPLWVLGAVLWRRGLLERTGMITLVFLTAYGAVIASAVSVSLIRTGADVYMKPVTAGNRLRLVLPGFERAIEPFAWWHVGLALIVATTAAALWCRGASRWRYRPLIRGALLACGLAALYASQFAFYNGEWPNPAGAWRYNFPGVLSRPLLGVTGAVAGLQLIRRLHVPGGIVRAIGAGLVAILLVLTLDTGWASLKQASEANASAARGWTNRLEGIAARLRREPARPVVIASHSVWDYEPIFAVPRFLTHKGVVNPLYLLAPVYRTDTPLTASLARSLQDVSRDGLGGYAPLDSLPPNTVPFAVGLSGPPPARYTDLGSLWPMQASSAAGLTRREGG
jgi:hypothetical protein